MKKVLLTLLILLTVVGCKPVSNDPKQTDNGVSCIGKDYVEKLRNYKVRDKKVSAENDNEDFDQFCNDIFAEMITSNFMDMHFLVTDYKALGLEKPEPKLASFSYSLNTEQLDYYQGIIDDLNTFDYSKLSYRQQCDFDALEYFCYQAMAGLCFYKYKFILCETKNEVDDVISYFTDYVFYDEESVDDYLTVEMDIDRFFDNILAYTADMAKAGYPLCDDWIDYTQDICVDFQNKIEDNVLITSFDKRIDELEFLSAEKKADVKKQNKEIVINEVVPAYQKVKEDVEKYRGKVKEGKYALYKLDKDYADYVYMKASSSNRTVDEMFQEMEDAYSLLQAEYLTCFYDEEAWQSVLDMAGGGKPEFEMDAKDTMAYLVSHTDGILPEIGEVKYDIEELDPDIASDSTIAYYWPNPVDSYDLNTIRTNPDNMHSSYYSYSTLAHEGAPGHMFQCVYYSKSQPNNLRRYLDFLGYMEGWAVYSSYLSFLMADTGDPYIPSVLFYETNDYFLEYSMIDIMVNYYGYNTSQIVDYFAENSLFEFDQYEAEANRKWALETAGSYIPYGVGYAEIINLRTKVQDKLGMDFDLTDFNKTLLINGPTCYGILETYINDHYGIN